MQRYLFPLLLGIVGVSILLSLGFWQVRRLAWKGELLGSIEARIGGTPTDFADLTDFDPVRDKYLPVTAVGATTGEELLVISGRKDQGAGYEVISAFKLADGRRIMLDRGFIEEADRDKVREPVSLTVAGNLTWPDESDSYTPPPDLEKRLWFARNVTTMSDFLHTQPILVVVRTAGGEDPTILPVPVDTAGIPNDHLGYAITWFSLAAAWAGMTAYLLGRIRQRTH